MAISPMILNPHRALNNPTTYGSHQVIDHSDRRAMFSDQSPRVDPKDFQPVAPAPPRPRNESQQRHWSYTTTRYRKPPTYYIYKGRRI